MDEMKKYIIEFSEDPHTISWMKIKNGDKFPTTEFKAVKPYIEPDLEQVRKEAYDKGYDDATEEIGSDEQTIADKAYKHGLSDAWEAARKVDHMSDEDIKNIFGCGFSAVFETIGASEAIEKIRQYEREKEEIKVGDEVIATSGKAVIVSINDNKDRARYIYPDSTLGFDNICNLSKTGRHFPEVSEVLEKIREE